MHILSEDSVNLLLEIFQCQLLFRYEPYTLGDIVFRRDGLRHPMLVIHFYCQYPTLLVTGYTDPAENNALWQLTD